MNIDLLKRTAKRIQEDYHHFDMNWFRKILSSWDTKDLYFGNLECGTVGCFAAHAIIEAKGKRYLHRLPSDRISPVARQLPGLTEKQADDLFNSTGDWYQENDKNIYSFTRGTWEYARFVARGIRRFIAAGGVQA